MRGTFSAFVMALSVVLIAPLAVIASGVPVGAQQSGQPPEPVKQIPLTEQQIENFIAAQKDMAAAFQQTPQGPEGPEPARLEAVAKKYKFLNYAEYEDVANNIGLVMDGIDPKIKKYVGAEIALKDEIAEVEVDKKMTPQDKKQELAQLNAELGSAQSIQVFPANIDLVTRYYDKLAAAMPQNE
jgi:hypothetical protein